MGEGGQRYSSGHSKIRIHQKASGLLAHEKKRETGPRLSRHWSWISRFNSSWNRNIVMKGFINYNSVPFRVIAPANLTAVANNYPHYMWSIRYDSHPTLQQKSSQGVGTPRNSWWGCAARFIKC